jgi:hypothetical protein
MINIEFETIDELSETLEVISNAVDVGFNKKHQTAYFNLNKKDYQIDLEDDAFRAGVIYGLSVAKEL